MVQYKVQVATGCLLNSGTTDNISIVLVGTNRESSKQELGQQDTIGAVNEYDVVASGDLGEILYVRLYKERFVFRANTRWYCKYVNVTGPDGTHYQFPCHLWLRGFMTLEVPEGKGVLLTGDVNPLLLQQRKAELEGKRESHRWRLYAEGAPYCIDADTKDDLPLSDQFSGVKRTSFESTLAATGQEVELKGLTKCTDSWTDLNDLNKVLFKKTPMSVLTTHMWKEDTFFGYQFLNGVNPVAIWKCTKIPENFPVTQDMVASTLGSGTDLQKELEEGNLFLADYKILEGIPPNTINGKPQYITAPLCLFWKSAEDHLLPLAIQLGQTPGPENPIFLASDLEWDWTLAKIWVRNADVQIHEAGSHLLYTHLLAEVFSIATSRQLPMQHPMYKAFVTGKGGIPILLKRAMEGLTYRSLCLPEQLKDRGMESIPKYYYREDGMKIWSAMERLVRDIVNYYYKDDDLVSKDPELQAWVEEIFEKGFLKRESSGIPSSLTLRAELIKYLTMVIFTCSAQHAATNSGQFDFYSWMPNAPSSLRRPPPTKKGETTFQSILDALPEVNTTANTMVVAWNLSKEPDDKKPLGTYRNSCFTEEMPLKFIQEFQDSMVALSKDIQQRNEGLKLTYTYLDPNLIESSISI
uniref:Uncharacterized protein n=1 Tax=Leptobrachium leishanense TaxID=445787 RepID=A0A8C5WDM0_9ANUR